MHLQLGARSLGWVSTRPTVCNPDPLRRIIGGEALQREAVPPALSLVRAIAVIPGGVSPQSVFDVTIVISPSSNWRKVIAGAASRAALSWNLHILPSSARILYRDLMYCCDACTLLRAPLCFGNMRRVYYQALQSLWGAIGPTMHCACH